MLDYSRSCTHPPPSISRRRSTRRPAFALTAFTVAFVAATAQVQPATATPLPFLDFLYPSFYSSPSPSPSTLSSKARRPSRSKPPPVPAAAPGLPAGLNAQQGQRKRQRQRRRLYQAQPYSPQLAKRETDNGAKVPIKYESLDSGWVVADSWDLHGHHRRTDPSAPGTPDPTPVLPVQNLDTTGNPASDNNDPNTDPYGGSIIINTAEDGLDLPVGWQHGPTARHESYDPVIVAVFAVILVMSILGTIGLCRWRARKLRKLRDLERMEREAEGSQASHDGDATDSEKRRNEKEKSPKRNKKSTGSSSAIRKRFARFRRRHRAKNGTAGNSNPTLGVERTDEDTDEEPNAATTTPDDSSAITINSRTDGAVHPEDRSAISSATSTIADDTSSLSINDTTPNEPLAETEIIITAPGGQPSPPLPTSSPPAYPLPPLPPPTGTGNTSARGMAENRPPPEKTPIRGLEAEYDERDLASYLAASSSAPPPPLPRRSRLRFADDLPPSRPLAGGEDQRDQRGEPVQEEEEMVPSFEPFASPPGGGGGIVVGPSRAAAVAAGATRRAHVATDDKGLLERMRSLADEPVLGVGGRVASAPVTLDEVQEGEEGAEESVIALAPPWSVVDEWDAERQLELVHCRADHGTSTQSTMSNSVSSQADRPSRTSIPGSSGADPSNSNSTLGGISTTSNPFPALPPPPSSISGATSGVVNYGLGAVWSTMDAVISSEEARGGRTPSAPPQLSSSLLPSAPPLLAPPLQDGDDAAAIVVPSAPPAWDLDDDTEAEQVEEAPTAPEDDIRQVQDTGDNVCDAHDAHETSIRLPDSAAPIPVPAPNTGMDRDADSDGTESIMSTPPDNGDPRSRWSATFRTRAEEGAGLPRYEP